MIEKKSLLLIFVKHPEAGKVKTRLAAGIGQTKALAAYQDLLAYTRKLAQEVEVDKEIWYGNEIPEKDLWSEVEYARHPQLGSSLGDRMTYAFQKGFSNGYERIVIIGSDCATLTKPLLDQAFSSLDTQDFVIGPAKDGGYYLLGMNRLFEQVFQEKNWSTETVFQDTLADLQSANLSFKVLEELSDIDTMDDLPGTFLEKYLDASDA